MKLGLCKPSIRRSEAGSLERLKARSHAQFGQLSSAWALLAPRCLLHTLELHTGCQTKHVFRALIHMCSLAEMMVVASDITTNDQ